jgi:hypothetical protein
MIPAILIVLLILPFVGEASARWPVAERSVVAKKTCSRERRGSS